MSCVLPALEVAVNVTGPDAPEALSIQLPLHVPASVFGVNEAAAVALVPRRAATATTSAKRTRFNLTRSRFQSHPVAVILFPIALLWLVIALVWIIRNSTNEPDVP